MRSAQAILWHAIEFNVFIRAEKTTTTYSFLHVISKRYIITDFNAYTFLPVSIELTILAGKNV